MQKVNSCEMKNMARIIWSNGPSKSARDQSRTPDGQGEFLDDTERHRNTKRNQIISFNILDQSDTSMDQRNSYKVYQLENPKESLVRQPSEQIIRHPQLKCSCGLQTSE